MISFLRSRMVASQSWHTSFFIRKSKTPLFVRIVEKIIPKENITTQKISIPFPMKQISVQTMTAEEIKKLRMEKFAQEIKKINE